MLFSAVGAVIRIMGQRAGECKEFAALLAFPPDFPRFTGSLLLFLFPGELLFAFFAEIGNMFPGRVIREGFPAVFAGLLQSACGNRGFLFGCCGWLRVRPGRFSEKAPDFVHESHLLRFTAF